MSKREPPEPYVCASLLQPFFELLSTHPRLGAGAAARVGLDPDARIPLSHAHALLSNAVTVTDDAELGLRAGMRVVPGDFGTLAFAVDSAATVQDAIEVAQRYMRLMNDALDCVTEVEGERARVILQSRVPVPRASADYQATLVARAFLQTPPRSVPGLEWHFQHPRPPDVSLYERALGPSRLSFSGPFFGFSFERSHLTTPHESANPKLHDVLRRSAERMLRDLPEVEDVAKHVAGLIDDGLSAGQPQADDIAKTLHMSRRTLTRKLAREGTSFSAILEDIRRRRAATLLAEGGVSTADLAFMLGFSDVPTFYKAFKRWYGQTPREYRRRTL